MDKVKQAVSDYLNSSDSDTTFLFQDTRKIEVAFRILKVILGNTKEKQIGNFEQPIPTHILKVPNNLTQEMKDQMEKLHQLI